MGAPKSRFYKSDTIIFDRESAQVLVQWASDNSEHVYKFDSLNGGELRALCAVEFGADNTGDATNESRIAALMANDATLLTAARGDGDIQVPPKLEAVPDLDDDVQIDVSPQDNGSPEAQALKALQALLGGSMDEAKVAAIAKVEALKVTAELRPTVIKVGDAPEVKIKGRPHKDLERVLKLLQGRNNPYLVGPAGTGKSTLGRQAAEALGVDFYSLPCNPTMSEVKVLGYMDASSNYVSTGARKAVENGGLFLLDEIDASHPAVLKGTNELTATPAGGVVSFPDRMVTVHENLYYMAAANTFGLGANRQYVGASQLDASTIDRFFMVEVGYDEDLEKELAHAIAGSDGKKWCGVVHRVRKNQIKHDLRVVVSTRAVEKGARALAMGFTFKEAFDGAIGASHDRVTNEKLLAGVTL